MKKKKKVQYSNLFAILFIFSSIYLIYGILLFDKIENFLRYCIVGLISIIDLFLLYKLFFGKKKKKKIYKYIVSTFLVLFSILFIYLGNHLNTIYSYFNNFDKKVIYSMSIVTLKDNNNNNLNKLEKAKIGKVTNDDENTESLSKDIINKYKLDKNNEIINYESNLEMINDLHNKKIDYVILPTNYEDIYGNTEEFENIIKEIVIVDTSQKEVTKEEVKLSGSSKDVTEPFTLLLIGIDSTVDGLEKATDSFNGDSLIIVTFNPKTFNATMLSIPRDSYVPITCMNNVDNKITHSSGHGGTKCVKSTIENFLDIKIDYYVKINFTGVVELVEALNGVEIDVPYSLCEQNSKREFGSNMVYIKKGLQTLNGEQALAYARNRKNNSNYCSKEWTQGERSDFLRAAHQQEVIQAILNKIKGLSSINDLENILKVISKNIDTNMDNSKIFSFYNVFKDVLISSSSDKALSIQKLYLDGDGQMIYDERSKLVLWDYILNQKSLSAVKQAMKDNLSGKKQELIKKFSYEIGETYKQKVIGEGYSGTIKYNLLKSLVGMNIKEAQTWATNNNLSLNIEYVKNTNKQNGIIIEQEYPDKKRIDLIPNGTMKVKVVKNDDDETTPTKVDCLIDPANKVCSLPNLIGKNKSEFETWGSKFSNVISRKYVEVESKEKEGTIIKIVDGNDKEISEGTTVKTLIDKKITLYINIAKEIKEENKTNDDNNKDNNTQNNTDNNNNNTDNKDNNDDNNIDNNKDNNKDNSNNDNDNNNNNNNNNDNNNNDNNNNDNNNNGNNNNGNNNDNNQDNKQGNESESQENKD